MTERNSIIITLGQANHGKTALVSAITKYLSLTGQAEYKPYEEIAEPAAEKIADTDVRRAAVSFATAKRKYTVLDGYSDLDCKSLLSLYRDTIDCALVVIDINDVITLQTQEQLGSAIDAGVGHYVVFLTKNDLLEGDEDADFYAEDMLDQVHTYTCLQDAPAIIGSGTDALNCGNDDPDSDAFSAIRELLAAIDSVSE